MSTMCDRPQKPAEWPVLVQMRGMLLQTNSDHKARQEESCGNAGSNIKIQGQSWAGKGLGIRGPMSQETALSLSEVQFALKKRLV